MSDRPTQTLAYGPHPAQVGDLRLPAGGGPAPVVVLFHGGFFLDPWHRDLMDDLAASLTQAGWATWNVEYRRLGPTGGGWETTLADACAAVDGVADLATSTPIDPAHVAVLGHSAGATLAAYAMGRHRLDPAAPGTPPRVTTVALVAIAGLLDLDAAVDEDLGDGAVTAFLGGPDVAPARAATFSPHRLVPVGAPTLLVHGSTDRTVPVPQSRTMAQAGTAAGDETTLRLVDTGHLRIIRPGFGGVEVVVDWLTTTFRA